VYIVGELVWIMTSFLLKQRITRGWGLLVKSKETHVDDYVMNSWLVLLHGKLVEVDESYIKKKAQICLDYDGSQKRVI
jgi:hypothetical protein